MIEKDEVEALQGVYDASVIVDPSGDFAMVECDGLDVQVYLHRYGDDSYYVVEVDTDDDRTAPFKIVVNDGDVYDRSRL